MQQSTFVLCAALILGGGLAHAQSTAQGKASAQSQSEVSASRSGASASNSAAGSAQMAGPAARGDVAGGGEMNATLTKPVDANRNKPGDEVSAVAADDMKSNGQVVVPKGSKLFGHVTSAKPRDGKGRSSDSGSPAPAGSAGGSAASGLGIIFDKAVLKDGREVPLHAAIRAIAAGEATSSTDLSHEDLAMSGAGSAMAAGRASGGGLLGGARGTVNGAMGATSGLGGFTNSTVAGSAGIVGRSAGAVGGIDSAGRITSGSRGAFGLKGLDVTSGDAASGGASLVTSGIQTVRLDKGTRMLLVTESANGAAAGSAQSRSSVGQVTGAAAASAAANGAANAGNNAPKSGSAQPARNTDTDRR